MQRRKFLIGMGSLAAGSAAALGTGAFTSVEADRSVSVTVADDANAFLSLEPTDGANAAYVDDTTGDALMIGFDETGAGGSGLNDDAYTIVRDVFKITNLGTQDIFVWIEQSTIPDGIGIFAEYPAMAEPEAGEPVPGPTEPTAGMANSQPKDGLPPVPIPARHEIPVGETMDEIGFSFKTGSRGGLGETDFEITIVAEETDQYSNYNISNNPNADQ